MKEHLEKELDDEYENDVFIKLLTNDSSLCIMNQCAKECARQDCTHRSRYVDQFV